MKEQPPTVCIVDDDEAVRGSLKLLLKTLGVPTLAYGSAQEFLAEFDPQRRGCLVLDIRMPGMSGLELQEELNQRGALLPIIFITGHGDVPMAVEAMQQGAMDFLQKPFRDQDLVDRINKALEKDRAGRELLGNRERLQARIAALTPREREVLRSSRRQGEQGDCRRSAGEPAHRRDPSRACHGKDGGEFTRTPGAHGHRSPDRRRAVGLVPGLRVGSDVLGWRRLDELGAHALRRRRMARDPAGNALVAEFLLQPLEDGAEIPPRYARAIHPGISVVIRLGSRTAANASPAQVLWAHRQRAPKRS